MTVRTSQDTVQLSGDVSIPLLGLGVWQLAGAVAYDSVRAALEIGYRHIDTATAYANEDRVGAAIRDSGLSRDEVFITTKFPPGHASQERETLEASLRALGTDYVDLWLVHWPPNGQAASATWKVFTEALESGKARSIGVSNYSIEQIDELIEATGQAPALNQIPWSPFDHDEGLAAALAGRGVVLEGYSPLKRSQLGHPVLAGIAAAHGKTAAQVVLRWHLQRGYVVIPRSSRRERIEENFDLYDFQLTDNEVRQLDALAQ